MSATFLELYSREQSITADGPTDTTGWIPCSSYHTLRITYKVDAPTGTTPRLELSTEFANATTVTSGNVPAGSEVDFFDQADFVTVDVPVAGAYARLKRDISGTSPSYVVGVRVGGIA